MKLQVLFVDDDWRMLQVLKRALGSVRVEWEVAFAGSGTEALGLIERFTFQVVVSDFQMPKMNGIQFLSEVRLRSPVTKRLMVSGSPDAERLNAKEKIAHRVLAKPLDVGELISTVNSLAEVDDEPA